MDVALTINQCSSRKSTSKAQVFKTVKFSIDFIQRSKKPVVEVILFCFFFYSDLFSYLIYFLSKLKELKGKTKFAIISVKTVKLAMENVHSLV